MNLNPVFTALTCPSAPPTRRLPLAACLAAALTQPCDVALAAPVVRNLPQPGVQIQQSAQTHVRLPTSLNVPAQPPAVASPPVPQRATEQRERRPAAPSALSLVIAAAEPPNATLQLKLSTTLQWPAQRPALAQATSPAQSASAATSEQPQWLSALLAMLDANEHDRLQPQLPAEIDAHAAPLRARADAALAERLGWALYRAQRYAQAVPWFELALQRGDAAQSAREGLVYALQQAGDLPRAYAAAQDIAALRRLRADIAVQIALQARARNDDAAAIPWLERAIADGHDGTDTESLLAWSELQAGQSKRAASRFTRLYAQQPSDDLAQGLYLSLQRSGQQQRIDSLARQSGPFADLVRRRRAQQWLDLGLARDAATLVPGASAELSGAAAPSVALGFAGRSKSGLPGTSQLKSTAQPGLDLRFSNTLGLWDIQAQAVRLDAGATPPVGLVGSTLPGPYGSPRQQDVGSQFLLRWRQPGPEGLQASIGSTPLDGAVTSALIGSLGWRSVSETGAYNAEIYRRTVDDSVLSLTGLRDPATGIPWGRVLREGVQAHGYTQIAPEWNLSAGLNVERLSGRNVASNTHWAGNIGLARDLPVPGMRFFSIGPNLGYEHYARNLSGFTWGQGGYFSPQRFVSGSLLGVFQTQDARRWVAAGQFQVGWQSVSQDASACFPLPPPAAPSPVCAALGASRSSGIGTSSALQWSGLLAPHWALEGSVQVRTGPAYQDRSIYLGLRYFFSPRRALFGSDLPAR